MYSKKDIQGNRINYISLQNKCIRVVRYKFTFVEFYSAIHFLSLHYFTYQLRCVRWKGRTDPFAIRLTLSLVSADVAAQSLGNILTNSSSS